MQLFDALLVQPIINLLVLFYQMLSWAHIPYALGFSIILLTVLVRLILYPLTTKQLHATKKMQAITPHLSKIKEKHKGDMKRQQEATMALYKEHGVNPAAGCLPGLVQIVILLFGLYPALRDILAATDGKAIVALVNKYVYFPSLQLTTPWDTHFFGLQLGKTPGELFGSFGIAILLIPLVTGVLQLIQSKMMMTQTTEKKTTSSKEEDFATMFQKQSLYLLPVMIGVFSWNFSLGLSLYWNTFTIFGIIQQYQVSGLGGLESWIAKVKSYGRN